MPTLDEVLTSDSVKSMYEAFQAGLLVTERPEARIPSMRSDEGDVNEAICRWVHYRLISSATYEPRKAPHPAYPYRATMWVSTVLAEGGGERWQKRTEGGDAYGKHVAAYVTRALVANQVAIKTSAGKSFLWLAPWPEGRKGRWGGFSHLSTIRPDFREERRIEEHSHAPVSEHVDLRIIRAPNPDPTSIIAWATRFVPAAIKVQQDLVETRKRLAEAEAKLAELEALASSPWAEAADHIATLLEGGGDDAEGGDEPGEPKSED